MSAGTELPAASSALMTTAAAWVVARCFRYLGLARKLKEPAVA
jgi:hypothetical protein